MSDVLDILSDIKNDTDFSTAKPGVVTEEDSGIARLTTELKDLTDQSTSAAALEAVRAERTVSKAVALEIFTMLPNPSVRLDNKLTEAPSAHNRELLLNSVAGNANFSNQYAEFLREINGIVNGNLTAHDELVASCETFLEISGVMLTELLFLNPTIVCAGRIHKLLGCSVSEILSMTCYASGDNKRHADICAKYRKIIDSASYGDISRQRGFKTADSDEALGVTVVDIVTHLTDIAKDVVSKANELRVISHNLQTLLSSDKVNPSIPSVYFESIFETIESVKRNRVLFTTKNSTANAVVELLKFLD